VHARAGLDAVEKRKKSLPCLCRESNPGRPDRSLVTTVISVDDHTPSIASN